MDARYLSFAGEKHMQRDAWIVRWWCHLRSFIPMLSHQCFSSSVVTDQ